MSEETADDLRDAFAMAALSGLASGAQIAKDEPFPFGHNWRKQHTDLARTAYALADAMLKARAL